MRMDPRLFDFTSRKWSWKCLPEEVAEKLSTQASADELLCVKANETRAVYRFENLFIKVCGSYQLKDQLRPAARSEYKAYCKLAGHNIPCVKHLGWGRFGHYTALVTEAWTDDAVDALYYWSQLVYNVRNTTDFLKELAVFLQQIVNSPLKHGDFHLGNILYSPSEKSFALVDLHNVDIGKEHTMREKADMLQILVDLRSSLRPQQMVEMFWQIGHIDADTAADTIRKKLIRDTERLQKNWHRRVKQFLSGYAKFSDFVSFEGNVLLVKRDKMRRNIFDPAAARRGEYRTVRLSFPAALEQMLFSFYLSELQVPHIPVAALAPNGTLYYLQAKEFDQEPQDREWVNSYNEYLLCMGLHLEDYHQWRHCSNSQLLLVDFNSMLNAMPHRERFRPQNVHPQRWKVKKRL